MYSSPFERKDEIDFEMSPNQDRVYDLPDDSPPPKTPQQQPDLTVTSTASSESSWSFRNILPAYMNQPKTPTKPKPEQSQRPGPVPLIDLTAMSKDKTTSIVGEQRETIKTLQAELEKYKFELSNQGRGMTRKNREIKELEDSLAASRIEYDELHKDASTEMSRLEEELKNARDDAKNSSETAQQNKQLQSDLEKVKAENCELEKAFEQCKTQIFSMQSDDQVSDAQVVRKFEQLRGAIGNWVDSQLDGASGYLTKANIALLESAKRSQVDDAFMLSNIRLAEDLPDLEPLLAEMIVGWYLYEHFLDPRLHFVGLDAAQDATLARIEKAVKNSKDDAGKSKLVGVAEC
jgi:hypothetical protein